MEQLADPRSTNLIRTALAAGMCAAALAGCTTSAETNTPVPIETTAAPEPTPSETPIVKPKPQPKPEDPIVTLQRNLNKQLVPLGMPALELDGKEGPQTNRAECAVRLFSGHKASKRDASPAEVREFAHTRILSTPLSGFIISKTCQVMGVNLDGHLSMIIPVSTGKPGKETPTGNFRVEYGRNDLHNSSAYPVEGSREEGNMYRPQYFYFKGKAAIAIHGSKAMTDGFTYPDSHGCVRVRNSDADKLWVLVGGARKLATGPKRDQVVKSIKHTRVHVLV